MSNTCVVLATLALSLALVACGDSSPSSGAATDSAPAAAVGSLTPAELVVEAPADAAVEEALAPVAAEDAGPVMIDVFSETGYVDERGRQVIDLLERDYAYLTARVRNDDGRPVQGARLQFAMDGSSRIEQMSEQGLAEGLTDETGMVEFGVIGGKMGMDRVTISLGERSVELMVNVISLKALGFPTIDDVEGALRWDELMKAKVSYGTDALLAEFPAGVARHDGEPVKLAGFMMPLEPERKQKHFLLTSNPPSCFFHVPGGPAGAVEVFAPEGVETSWDPVVLEGRFETVSRSEMGVVYRLRDARLRKP